MKITYPHIIENCIGEKLIFQKLQKYPDGDRLLVENYVAPGSGPVMHTHWLQDECLSVIHGTLGYQIQGEPKQYAGQGKSVMFKRGIPHRFWNEGQDTLHCKGWLKPANTIVFFLSSLYDAQTKSGKAQPEQFDGAYLMNRYATEYDLPEIPPLVKKVIIPITYAIGKILGQYKHFKDAPDPIKHTTKNR